MTALPIELPNGYTSLVSTGDTITHGQIIAQHIGAREAIVNIPEMLSIPLNKVKNVLQKNPGDAVSRGDVIAQTHNLFGKKPRKIISEVTGTVIRYDRKTGQLTVLTDQLEEKGRIKSPVAGIVGLCNNKEIVIKTDDAALVYGVAIGQSKEGNLFVLEESFQSSEAGNALYYLDRRAVDKIALVKKLTPEMFMKGMSIGVKGFLTTELDNQDIEYFTKKDTDLAILEISTEALPMLKAWSGRPISVDTMMKAIIVTKK